MLPPPERRLRILLCGYGHLGLALLQGLLEHPEQCELVGVFRWSSKPGSAVYWESTEVALARLIVQEGLTDLACPGINSYEFATLLQTHRPDILLIGSWGEIIKPHVLQHPGLLVINCHPSLLPRHRGANPYASVLLAGELETGVTFHRVAPKIDAGPILLQRTILLNEADTGDSVRARCAQVARDMVDDLLKHLKLPVLEGVPLKETEQNASQMSYYPPLKAEWGQIDWRHDVTLLSRQIRGLYPWVVLHGYVKGRMVLFDASRLVAALETSQRPAPVSGTILSQSGGRLRIATADPQWVMDVPAYRLAVFDVFFPRWLSRLIAPLLGVREGRVFDAFVE